MQSFYLRQSLACVSTSTIYCASLWSTVAVYMPMEVQMDETVLCMLEKVNFLVNAASSFHPSNKLCYNNNCYVGLVKY